MKTVIEMARDQGLPETEVAGVFIVNQDDLGRFAEFACADERNATLEEIADKIGKMPFGDTAASFAVWIREQKTCT
jgi:hypothetical protein